MKTFDVSDVSHDGLRMLLLAGNEGPVNILLDVSGSSALTMKHSVAEKVLIDLAEVLAMTYHRKVKIVQFDDRVEDIIDTTSDKLCEVVRKMRYSGGGGSLLKPALKVLDGGIVFIISDGWIHDLNEISLDDHFILLKIS